MTNLPEPGGLAHARQPRLAAASLAERRHGPTWRPRPVGPLPALKQLVRRTMKELHQITTSALNQALWKRRRMPIIRAYLATHEVRALQLGSGAVKLEGWLNADLRPRTPDHIFLDALDRFPFANDVLDFIHSEHMIGDFTYQQCFAVLNECHRVLRPGGRIRLSTPDLERLTSLYGAARTAEQEHYLHWSIENNALWTDSYLPGLVINNQFQEYPFVYDRPILTHLLSAVGFVDVSFFDVGDSATPTLRDIDSHGAIVGDDRINRFEAVTVEATKPSAATTASRGSLR